MVGDFGRWSGSSCFFVAARHSLIYPQKFGSTGVFPRRNRGHRPLCPRFLILTSIIKQISILVRVFLYHPTLDKTWLEQAWRMTKEGIIMVA